MTQLSAAWRTAQAGASMVPTLLDCTNAFSCASMENLREAYAA